MSTGLTTNIAELGLFQRDLDAFEDALPTNSASPSNFRVAAEFLESALRRISGAAPGDGYQMLRLFALRYLDMHRPYFNAYNVLMTITTSYDGAFKQLAMPVLYEMAGLLGGNPYLTDDIWFNSVNRLACVKLFFDTLSTSGLRLLANPPSTAVMKITGGGAVQEYNQPTCTLLAGIENPHALLTGFENPYITLRRDPLVPRGMGALLATVTITSMSGRFVLGPGLLFTPPAAVLLGWANVLTVPYSTGTATEINLAGPFHSCELLCLSTEGGNFWSVIDVQFLAPN